MQELGRAEAAGQETEKAEGRGQNQAAHRGEGWLVLSGRPGRGSVTWLQGVEGTFSGLTRGPAVGRAVPTKLATKQGARGALPAGPLPWLHPQAQGLGRGNGGVSGLGPSWAEPGMLPPRLGRSLPPTACSRARAHPSFGSVSTLGPSLPTAIARPP